MSTSLRRPVVRLSLALLLGVGSASYVSGAVTADICDAQRSGRIAGGTDASALCRF